MFNFTSLFKKKIKHEITYPGLQYKFYWPEMKQVILLN